MRASSALGFVAAVGAGAAAGLAAFVAFKSTIGAGLAGATVGVAAGTGAALDAVEGTAACETRVVIVLDAVRIVVGAAALDAVLMWRLGVMAGATLSVVADGAAIVSVVGDGTSTEGAG
jgi:hypothetical protein